MPIYPNYYEAKMDNKNDFYTAVEQERNARRGVSPLSLVHGNYWRSNSDLREIAARLDNPQVQLDEGVGQYFQSLVDKVPSLLYFIALPRIIMSHPVLGTNVAMNALMTMNSEKVEELESILDELSQMQNRIPELPDVSAKLTNNYLEQEITMGECYWLLRLCTWLRCETPEFISEMKMSVFAPRHWQGSSVIDEPIRTRNINYHDVSPSMASYGFFSRARDKLTDFRMPLSSTTVLYKDLLAETIKQYRVLEDVLRRFG